MKKARFLLIVLTLLAAIAGVCACNDDADYTVTLSTTLSYELEVGDEPDFTKYFDVKDKNGAKIAVTEDMLDLSNVDLSKPGTFTVTFSFGDVKTTADFVVKAAGTTPEPTPSDPDTPPPATSNPFEVYADRSTWNFAVTVSVEYDEGSYEDAYEYDGTRIKNTYLGEDDVEYTDYLDYDVATDSFTYYYDNGDGTYTSYDEDSDEFYDYYMYSSLIDLSYLADYTFQKAGNVYLAVSPAEVGNDVLGEYDAAWTSVSITFVNGKITKIFGRQSDGSEMTYAFSDHGNVHITLPQASEGSDGGDGGDGEDVDPTPTPSGTIDKQNYDPSTFDNDRLQKKMEDSGDYIGLPSTGTYNALVIPVEFQDDRFTQSELTNLDYAFNSKDSSKTGWESVSSYYEKSSYGNLKLTFDIQDPYQAKNNVSYYESYQQNTTLDGEKYTITGEEIILNEALAYYENKLDLTKYDFNNDDVIDAVYIIYSAPVDYENADFYWAYVTWYYGYQQYDGKDVYYYLFASIDFMLEKTAADNVSRNKKIPGMKINAETYIHETGHLLGLDDYYDYYKKDTYSEEFGGTIKAGSNEGLGGADMMDYNIGDHGVYSKIMLGWLTPTIVNETTTLEISCSATTDSAILIPLNFDNSYFCEYLLIDLYANTGLNAMHSSDLYEGASCGVRIYHVASSINNPYQDDYGSFTDNNNSVSENALVKLVEADGDSRFKSSSDGTAEAKDLWKAGQTFSAAFPNYTRYDGKLLNFDIKINTVSATSASITITFSN